MDFLQGKNLLHKDNELILADTAMKKKTLLLFYFTSIKCDLCKTFDVKLKDVYQQAVRRRIELGIIIVSSDSNEESYLLNKLNNYNEWYAVPFNDDLTPTLTYYYGVTHIPSLIVVRRNGTLVTREGREEVEKIGVNVLVTWLE